MKKRHSEEQIIRILREAESREEPIKDVCRQHNITEQTLYRWRNKYGGMDVAEAGRLKELESENAKLKDMPRFGYRRMAAWVSLSEARVRRMWRTLGLNIPRRRPRRRRSGSDIRLPGAVRPNAV
jgi:putative transposase